MSRERALINIFVSPGEVFQNLRRHPRWLVAVLVMTIASSIFANLFVYRLGAERIANFAIDKTLEMSMIQNNEDAKKNVEASRPQAIADAKDPVVRAGQAVNGFVGVILVRFSGLVFFPVRNGDGRKNELLAGICRGCLCVVSGGYHPLAVELNSTFHKGPDRDPPDNRAEHL